MISIYIHFCTIVYMQHSIQWTYNQCVIRLNNEIREISHSLSIDNKQN
jgi:hypothetical protein